MWYVTGDLISKQTPKHENIGYSTCRAEFMWPDREREHKPMFTDKHWKTRRAIRQNPSDVQIGP